jgi:hypothetical protein
MNALLFEPDEGARNKGGIAQLKGLLGSLSSKGLYSCIHTSPYRHIIAAMSEAAQNILLIENIKYEDG